MKLSLAEQETIVTYAGDEKTCHISTAYAPDIEYYDKLCETRPEFIKCVKRTDTYMYYEAQKRPNSVRVRAPQKVSEEKRERARALAASRRANTGKS